MTSPITILGIERHRNGISGIGFYLVKFLHEETELLSIVHDRIEGESYYYSVINPADITDCYRAEYFLDAIETAIHLHEKEIRRELNERIEQGKRILTHA